MCVCEFVCVFVCAQVRVCVGIFSDFPTFLTHAHVLALFDPFLVFLQFYPLSTYPSIDKSVYMNMYRYTHKHTRMREYTYLY